MSATRSHDSASLTYWVVTSIVRPVVAQAVELLPDAGAEQRVDARPSARRGTAATGRGRARRRARAAAACRRTAGPARRPRTSHRSTQLEDLARPPPARAEQHAEQRRDEVDVLADRQVRIEGERLGHVADPLACLPPELARLLAQHAIRCRDVGVRRAGEEPDRRGLARARRPDRPRIVPGGTTSEMPSTASWSSNRIVTSSTTTAALAASADTGRAAGSIAPAGGGPAARSGGVVESTGTPGLDRASGDRIASMRWVRLRWDAREHAASSQAHRNAARARLSLDPTRSLPRRRRPPGATATSPSSEPVRPR